MAEVTIDYLGRQGDGIAREADSQIYVPFTLPGERVSVSGKGQRRGLVELHEKSPERIEPVCSHFGACGGCQLQHVSDDTYKTWKRSLLTGLLDKAGIKHAVDPLTTFDDASRRKCVFNVRNTQQGVVLGFSERSSDTVLSISSCPVLVPQISESLDDLREICASLPQTKKPFRLSVLATQNGLDLSLEGSVPLNENTKTVLVRKALASGFARFSSDGEILIEQQKPVLKMGICEVAPPPGSFVQAVEAAETAMANLVCDHLSDCKSVADLFCGIGTFALRLAGKSTVWAVEENASALAALDHAWRETGGKLKQVKTETRNLDRRPASFQEMKKIDGLVFDPPRAGAEAQARQIAKSKVRKVAAVSCNPVTLVRDLGILMDGGYRIHRITPIDQFKYTPHVEVVVLLER